MTQHLGGRMKLTIIGCSGSFPGPESPASCYLVEATHEGRTYQLVLDLGSGALGPLQRYADLRDIDAVALTHLHPDHCIDLCGFYVARKYHPDGPLTRVPVYGPAGTAERLAKAYGLDEQVGMSNEFAFATYPDGPLSLGPFTVEVMPVDHPVPAYAIKVTHAGRSLVYSGDTGPCAALDEIAADCDLLLAEASFVDKPDNPEHLHMTGGDAARAAEKAGARRLVLTHIPPWHEPSVVLDEARPHFSGELSIASPGATYEV